MGRFHIFLYPDIHVVFHQVPIHDSPDDGQCFVSHTQGWCEKNELMQWIQEVLTNILVLFSILVLP
jgi:hypothetical protein